MSSEPAERKRVLDRAILGCLLFGVGGGGSAAILAQLVDIIPLWALALFFAGVGILGLIRLYQAVRLEQGTDFSEVLGLE